ncbi:MAG: hypothetical protein WDN50_15485 [Bradyrhizobium sp.]
MVEIAVLLALMIDPVPVALIPNPLFPVVEILEPLKIVIFPPLSASAAFAPPPR